jgi:hypothetical protein
MLCSVYGAIEDGLEQVRADQLSKVRCATVLAALKKSQALQRANNLAT